MKSKPSVGLPVFQQCQFPRIAKKRIKIKKMTQNFTKVTKYLISIKETLLNYVSEKSQVKRQ